MTNLRRAMFAVMLLPLAVTAQTGASIAVIDFQGAALNSDDGIEAQAAIEARAAELEAELGNLQADLAAAQTRYETQQRALSATALAGLETEITRLQTQINRAAEDADLEIQLVQAQVLQPVSERVREIVLAYAEETGLDLILDATAGIVYASEATNITAEVVRRMNEASAAEAPVESAAPANPEP